MTARANCREMQIKIDAVFMLGARERKTEINLAVEAPAGPSVFADIATADIKRRNVRRTQMPEVKRQLDGNKLIEVVLVEIYFWIHLGDAEFQRVFKPFL